MTRRLEYEHAPRGFLSRSTCHRKIGGIEEQIARVEEVLEEEREFLDTCDYVDGHGVKQASREKIEALANELTNLRRDRDAIIERLEDEVRL